MEQSFSLRSHPSPSGRPVSCWHCVTLGRCPNFSSLLAHWGVCMGVWGVVQSPWLINCCSVNQSCPTLCDPMDCSTPGFPVLHHLFELAQTHVHWVSDAIQPSYPLSSPSLSLNLSQHHSLFQWVSILHQVTKVLELQFQYQSFQWIFRVDFL